MAEYLELARAVIEEREGAVSADMSIFHLNEKQCIGLWPRLCRNLRKTFDYFPWNLSYLQPTARPMSRQVFKELAQTIIRQKESATRSAGPTILSLNEIQCTHLWRIIRVVYNYLASSQLPAALHHEVHEDLPEIFREFYVLVTRANATVQQFISKQSWLQAAIFQRNQRLALEELILDLQTCISEFHQITKHPVPIEASGTIWKQAMERGAKTDGLNFRSRIEDLLALPALGEDERRLAHYLLEREESMSSSDSQDVDLPQFFIAKGAYPTEGTPIGRGSSGVVLEVKWLGMTCAKKIFLGDKDNHGTMRKECQKEVLILAKLNHPRIVKLICTSDRPEISFLMELMPMSLSAFLEDRWRDHKGGIIPAAAIDIMLQISQGIERLHDLDIVHRDVKPSNILVSPSAHKKMRDEGCADVKLTDFGLAKMKAAGLAKPTQEKMGTPYWRAPEAFAADEPIDWKRADAYSFAMTCSVILTGDTPFDSGLPLSKLYTRITSGERPKLPSSCPEALASLLKLCWDTTPSVRPSFTHIREELTSIKRCLLTGSLKWTSLGNQS